MPFRSAFSQLFTQDTSIAAGVFFLVAVALGAAVLLGSRRRNAQEFPRHPKPAVRVQVTAFQWCWRFRYEGQPVTVTGQCQGGSFPTLVLPAGEPVELDVTSTDVVHAFWLPYLRFKTIAYPGHVNAITTTSRSCHRPRSASSCGRMRGSHDRRGQAGTLPAPGRGRA